MDWCISGDIFKPVTLVQMQELYVIKLYVLHKTCSEVFCKLNFILKRTPFEESFPITPSHFPKKNHLPNQHKYLLSLLYYGEAKLKWAHLLCQTFRKS